MCQQDDPDPIVLKKYLGLDSPRESYPCEDFFSKQPFIKEYRETFEFLVPNRFKEKRTMPSPIELANAIQTIMKHKRIVIMIDEARALMKELDHDVINQNKNPVAHNLVSKLHKFVLDNEQLDK